MSSKFVQTFLHCPRPGLVWLFQTLRCEQRIQWQCSAPTVLRLVLPGVLWQLTTALLLGAFAKVLSVSQLPKGSKSPIIRHHPFFSAKKYTKHVRVVWKLWLGTSQLKSPSLKPLWPLRIPDATSIPTPKPRPALCCYPFSQALTAALQMITFISKCFWLLSNLLTQGVSM